MSDVPKKILIPSIPTYVSRGFATRYTTVLFDKTSLFPRLWLRAPLLKVYMFFIIKRSDVEIISSNFT